MRLSTVHIPRGLLTHSASSRTDGGVARNSPPVALYGMAGAMALTSVLLILLSRSEFEARPGGSALESLAVLAGVAGFFVAAGCVFGLHWGWTAANGWLCGVMAIELGLYGSEGSYSYVVMALCILQVVCLRLPDVKRLLQPVGPLSGRDERG